MWSCRKSKARSRTLRPGVKSGSSVSQAFTLLEILLTLALLALLGTVLVSGANAIFRAASHPAAEEIFWRTVSTVRQLALTGGRTVSLRFDEKTSSLAWTDGATAGTQPLANEGTAALQFLQPRQGSAVLLGGQVVETSQVPCVKFYPDGSCDSFRVQIKLNEAPPFVLAIDPWTCAPMLEEKK